MLRIQDVLAENLDNDAVAISSSEEPDGSWSLALHFTGQPDENASQQSFSSDTKTTQEDNDDEVETRIQVLPAAESNEGTSTAGTKLPNKRFAVA